MAEKRAPAKPGPFVPDEVEDDSNPEPDVGEPDDDGTEAVPPGLDEEQQVIEALAARGIVVPQAEVRERLEATKPPIVGLFEKLGIVKDAHIASIKTRNGKFLNDVRVQSVHACLEPFEIVITVKEDGVAKGLQHKVRWDAIDTISMH